MKNKKVAKISKRNWIKLKEFNDNSVDKNLNDLIDAVENEMPFVAYDGELHSIHLHKTTADRLDSFRITQTESRDNIIERLFLMYDEINNIGDNYVSFKLTSPLNKRLCLTGQLDLTNQQISFNYNGELYIEELPVEYMVDDENLTNEFVNWINLVDMLEVKALLVANSNESEIIEVNKDNYKLIINLVEF